MCPTVPRVRATLLFLCVLLSPGLKAGLSQASVPFIASGMAMWLTRVLEEVSSIPRFFFLWMNVRLYWKHYQHLLRRANNSSFPSVYTWVLPMKSPRVLCPGILCTVNSRHISFHSLKFLCPITTSSSFLLKWWASRLPLGHRQGWGLSRRYRDVWRRCGVRDGSPGSSSVPGLEQQHGFLTLKTSLGRQWQLPWATSLL